MAKYGDSLLLAIIGLQIPSAIPAMDCWPAGSCRRLWHHLQLRYRFGTQTDSRFPRSHFRYRRRRLPPHACLLHPHNFLSCEIRIQQALCDWPSGSLLQNRFPSASLPGTLISRGLEAPQQSITRSNSFRSSSACDVLTPTSVFVTKLTPSSSIRL